MKNYLLASLLLLAGCGTKNTETAATADAAQQEAAPEAAMPAMDLTSYGVPLTINVPAGTTATRDGDKIKLEGPKVRMSVDTEKEGAANAAKLMANAKKGLAMFGYTDIDSTQALSVQGSRPGHPERTLWAVMVPVQSTGKLYSVSLPMMMAEDSTFTAADKAAMLNMARTAKPTGK